MKLLFYSLLAILLSASCKKERESTPLPKTGTSIQNVRLSQMTEKWEKGYTEQRLFIYNDAGYISRIVYKLKGENDDSLMTENWIDYVYDAQNILIKEIVNYSSHNNVITGVYKYNDQGKLAVVDYAWDINPAIFRAVSYKWENEKLVQIQDKSGYTTWIQYAGDNVAGISRNGRHGWEYVYYKNIVYDNKPNYLKTVKGLQNLTYALPIKPQAFSANNVTECRVENINITGTYTYTLTYNQYNHVEREDNKAEGVVREYAYEIVQ